MKKITHKQAGWLMGICLFAGCAFSMVATFRGSIPLLIVGIIALAAGIYFLKIYLSGQFLS